MHNIVSSRGLAPSLFLVLGLFASLAASITKAGGGSVRCTTHEMDIRVPLEGVTAVKLDKWSSVPGCRFTHAPSGQYHTIHLPLDEELACGTTRVRNTATGASLYYQRLRIYNSDGSQEHLLVKCSTREGITAEHNIVRRDLPPSFVEPDFIEITSEIVGSAPVPILGVGVRQDGSLVDGAINVTPGTPLAMEVYLDDESSGIYGILVSYLEVTDNDRKKETIVYNGCTIDANLFENFDTDGGDLLSAKFRAFKFPESTMVLFRGTVDVCLDKCKGITCFDGKVGYGRKRRSIDGDADPNKLFEVTMTTFIKFSENVTDTGTGQISEIFAEDVILRERLSNSELSSRRYETPLIRRSSDTPPSISFEEPTSAASTVHTLLTALPIMLSLHFW